MLGRLKRALVPLALGTALVAGPVVVPAAPVSASQLVEKAAPTHALPVPMAARAAVRTVTYAGSGRTVHLGSVGHLSGTSRSFRAFVTRQLTVLWHEAGGTSACKRAPYVTVKRWRSDGFAQISGIGNGSPCPGGGYHAIWIHRDGAWRAPVLLGSQESFWCTDLKGYRVPYAVSGGTCYPELGALRSYRGFRQPARIHTVSYAAKVVARSVNAVSPVATARWASRSVVDRLYDMHWNGDRLTIVTCFTRTDPTYGPYLGTATRGCLLDAAYYGNGGSVPTYRATYVLRMRPAVLGRWRVAGMVGHSSS